MNPTKIKIHTRYGSSAVRRFDGVAKVTVTLSEVRSVVMSEVMTGTGPLDV